MAIDESTRSLIDKTVESLAECADDALSEAACGGLIDPQEVIDWTQRAKRLVLFQRDRSFLRAELPVVVERLDELVRQVELPGGVTPEFVVSRFVRALPDVRDLLAGDVEAAHLGDPAARGYEEIVVAYPAIRVLAIHRLAHELYSLRVPLLPRIMNEYAHGLTGIDIHPGARIGRRFFIDHGTGVVIGETAEVGDRVRIYQGVTLGATSIRNSQGLRGVKRHPTIEDDVTIYAGAKILGGQTVIGRGSVIGGNVWLTESVPPGSRVVAEPARQLVSQREGEMEESGMPLQLKWDI